MIVSRAAPHTSKPEARSPSTSLPSLQSSESAPAAQKFARALAHKRDRERRAERAKQGSRAMADASTSNKTPADFLKSIKGQQVLVKLNSGANYKGVLACLDGYMNLAMEQTEEYNKGGLTNKYGDCFIRGNNVLYIHARTSK